MILLSLHWTPILEPLSVLFHPLQIYNQVQCYFLFISERINLLNSFSVLVLVPVFLGNTSIKVL